MGDAFVFLILANDLWYDEQNQHKLFRVFLLIFCADFFITLNCFVSWILEPAEHKKAVQENREKKETQRQITTSKENK